MIPGLLILIAALLWLLHRDLAQIAKNQVASEKLADLRAKKDRA